MTITRNIDKTTRTVGEMAEAQRRSYEAVADNIAAFQRRGAELARNGAELLELQERNARAAQEWWTSGLRVLQLQQRNARFAQNWLTGGAEALRGQAEDNVRTAEAFARNARTQREGFQRLAREWAGFYRGFLFSPLAYAQEATERGLQATRQATEQGLQLAVEASEQAGHAVEQTARRPGRPSYGPPSSPPWRPKTTTS